jgi:hypothetical protein
LSRQIHTDIFFAKKKSILTYKAVNVSRYRQHSNSVSRSTVRDRTRARRVTFRYTVLELQCYQPRSGCQVSRATLGRSRLQLQSREIKLGLVAGAEPARHICSSSERPPFVGTSIYRAARRGMSGAGARVSAPPPHLQSTCVGLYSAASKLLRRVGSCYC